MSSRPARRKARQNAKGRKDELWRMLSSKPYNRLLKPRNPIIIPESAISFYTVSCGKVGIIKPHTEPTGVIFSDGSFLKIFEKWTVDQKLLEYSYRYQVPFGISIIDLSVES